MPEAYDDLLQIRKRLESHYHDMQDIEFTIQDKNLYMLQTRTGKRTAAATCCRRAPGSAPPPLQSS